MATDFALFMGNARYNASSYPVVGRACSPLLSAQEFHCWKASAYFLTVFGDLSFGMMLGMSQASAANSGSCSILVCCFSVD